MDEGPVDARARALHGGELHVAGTKKSLEGVRAGRDDAALDTGDGRLGNACSPGQLSLGQPGPAATRSKDCRSVHTREDIISVSAHGKSGDDTSGLPGCCEIDNLYVI